MNTIRANHLWKFSLLGLAVAYWQTPAQAEEPWTKDIYAGAAIGMAQGVDDTASGTRGGTVKFDNGAAVSAFVGKPLGANLRGEAELGHRSVGLDSIAGSPAGGDAKATSLMGNLLLDIDAGLPVTPYVGAGAGLARMSLDNASPFGTSAIDGNDTVGAVQAIAGASYTVQDNLKVFADYRYFATADGNFTTAAGIATSLGLKTHSVLAGLRFTFGTSGPAALSDGHDLSGASGDNRADMGHNSAEASESGDDTPPPAPATEQAAAMDHTLPDTYMVHFELNKAEVLPEAITLIEQVASNAKANNVTRLILTGHTDTSGPEAFNLDLSRQRAESVRTAFIALGFKEEEVTIKAMGETQLLVPTGDDVFEPKNRRVEIVLPQ